MVATIKDVAKKANVSIATVSRILNNQTGYSEKTKKKVLDAIEILGYQPNAVARGLVSRRTHSIGILFPKLSSLFTSELLSGIENIAHSMESSVIVCHTESDGMRTMKYLQLLNEKRIDGLIFTSEVLTDEYYAYIKKMDIPVILLSTESYAHALPYVKVNDFHAAYTATYYLIEKGHSKIGMISGNKKDPIAGIPRINGFKGALEDHHIPLDDYRIIYADDFNFEAGVENFKTLMKQAPDTTALFAASDEIAIGAISAANQIGVKIPDDISIIGYDNLKIAEMSIPPLTTVAQPLQEMGKMAGKLLFELLEENCSVESRIMPHRIIERGSVKSLQS